MPRTSGWQAAQAATGEDPRPGREPAETGGYEEIEPEVFRHPRWRKIVYRPSSPPCCRRLVSCQEGRVGCQSPPRRTLRAGSAPGIGMAHQATCENRGGQPAAARALDRWGRLRPATTRRGAVRPARKSNSAPPSPGYPGETCQGGADGNGFAPALQPAAPRAPPASGRRPRGQRGRSRL